MTIIFWKFPFSYKNSREENLLDTLKYFFTTLTTSCFREVIKNRKSQDYGKRCKRNSQWNQTRVEFLNNYTSEARKRNLGIYLTSTKWSSSSVFFFLKLMQINPCNKIDEIYIEVLLRSDPIHHSNKLHFFLSFFFFGLVTPENIDRGNDELSLIYNSQRISSGKTERFKFSRLLACVVLFTSSISTGTLKIDRPHPSLLIPDFEND